MKILVTGAKGFLGKNLVENLKNVKYGKSKVYPQTDLEILEFDIDTEDSLLEEYLSQADFVYHLAGVNRPKDKSEFYTGNTDLTARVLNGLKNGKKAPIMISSTIWASADNDYGKSKREAEKLVEAYSLETGATSYIYRFTNLFGKWSRPSYNSVVATFCHNVANGLDITISDPNATVNLCYVDDVVYGLIDALFGKVLIKDGFCYIEKTYTVTLGRLAELVRSFKDAEKTLKLPDCEDEFTKKLYAMYLTYVPLENLKQDLKVNADHRGSFTETYKLAHGEQVSFNVVAPNKLKGNHWHNTKIERFTVVGGEGVIRLRKIGDDKVYEYWCKKGEQISVDIPAGYTHNMENTGSENMLVMIWCNEEFDPNNPDTFFEEV